MLFCQAEAQKITGYGDVSNKKKKDKTMADQGVEDGGVCNKKTNNAKPGNSRWRCVASASSSRSSPASNAPSGS